tara:strand:- start:213 stop:995 length:783 start_codon:yes stop_codon:yes gene_type:complete
MYMGVIRRYIAPAIGILMTAFVVVNVQFGLIAPEIIDGAGPAKLDVMKMLEPHCAISEIELELSQGSDSFCLGPVGEWNGADFLLLGEGLFILLVGRFKLPQKGRWAVRIRKIMFVTGCSFFGLAILDRIGVLPTAVGSEGIATLIPFDVSPLFVQIGLAVIGAFLMRGPKYWEAEAIDQTNKRLEGRREIAEKFRSTFGTTTNPLSELEGKQKRVARSPLMHRDSKLSMSRSKSNIKVKATCPYCKGGGCKKCDWTGVI